MSRQGATLQKYNNELVKYFEELNTKKELLSREIESEVTEKRRLTDEISRLQLQLKTVDENLDKKLKVKQEYDTILNETQTAYNKILEGSQALLTVLKKESVTLGEKMDNMIIKPTMRD